MRGVDGRPPSPSGIPIGEEPSAVGRQTKRVQIEKQSQLLRLNAPMTTFRQIEANRRNARKSTGPTTEEGNRIPAAMQFGMGSPLKPSSARWKTLQIIEPSRQPLSRTTTLNRLWSGSWSCA